MKLRRDHSFCHGKCLPAFFSAEWFVDLDHFCTVKATKQNHVWVFFPRESFPVALSFLFLNNKQSIPPSLDNRLNSRRKFDRHLGIDYDWSVDIQSGSHHQSRRPSCLFSFHLENRRTNPPPSPPTPLMLQFSFIPLSSPQRIWSSLNSCYQTSYRFGWLCAWTAWRTRMSFLHLIFRS